MHCMKSMVCFQATVRAMDTLVEFAPGVHPDAELSEYFVAGGSKVGSIPGLLRARRQCRPCPYSTVLYSCIAG